MWLLVDSFATMTVGVVCAMALVDYWPPSPFDLVIGVGLAVATIWWLALGAMLIRRTLRAKRQSQTNGET